MRDITKMDLRRILSENEFSVILFTKCGGGQMKIPVQLEAVDDQMRVYFRQELYMRIFYGLMQGLKYEYINFDLQIVKFVYEDTKVGLQLKYKKEESTGA